MSASSGNFRAVGKRKNDDRLHIYALVPASERMLLHAAVRAQRPFRVCYVLSGRRGLTRPLGIIGNFWLAACG